MSNQFKILLSRFLTRFGDQAWDFAVPIILIQIFPHRINLIALFFLLSKLINIIIGPFLLKRIDHTARLKIYKIGIGTQVLAMIFSFPILMMWQEGKNLDEFFIIPFVILTGLHAWANLGATLMDVAIGLDLAVDSIQKEELSIFNGRLKRLDLITEVTAPVITGLILTLSTPILPSLGLLIIALINLATFIPEYFLLRSVIRSNGIDKIVTTPSKSGFNLKDFSLALKNLRHAPYTPVILAYTFLWFSVLSPHGVLLTSYLKDTGALSEVNLGFFRSAGALFGIIPTFIFTPLRTRFGLLLACNLLLLSQGIFVTIAQMAFSFNHMTLFLIFILFSRIGLYGFSIGEVEVRQSLIPPHKRGEINGIANSLTNLATLFIFLLGILITKTDSFNILVSISVIAVIGAVMTMRLQKL